MIILGLNHGETHASAAITRNGSTIAGAAEERFNRQKRSRDFPRKAIEFCLKFAGVELKQCDYIAQAWNPGAGWHKYNPLISRHRIRREDNFYSIPDNLFNITKRRPGDWTLMSFPKETGLPPIYHIQHHRTHAAAAFFLSPYEEAAILTCDWRGEFETTSLNVGTGNTITLLGTQNIPDSLGMFYATYTELLGYEADNDEWKVMALSAFDVECTDLAKKIRSTIKLLDHGRFEMDPTYYKGAILDQPKLYTDKLATLLGGKEGRSGNEPEDWHYCVAKAMQTVAEEIAAHMLTYLHKKTRLSNLVLGGGFFMNCVFNGKVPQLTPFKNVYVNYAPGDLGNSVGAALYVSHCLFDEERNFSHNSSAIGPEYSDAQIEAALRRRKIGYNKVPRMQKKIADLLAAGHIVAVMSGRMEFGERALGNRSILADPRDAKMKDRINAMIKYRESYRPFAPAVIEEKAHVYFDVPVGYESNYMERVVPVKPEHRKKLPAITHLDGSARLQTVSKEHNPFFYAILSEFGKLTSYPVLLNTSFNINGEPIVLSPDDVLNTFFNSGLEVLAIGSFLVMKNSCIVGQNSGLGVSQ
jgi:carbamoyltransferase